MYRDLTPPTRRDFCGCGRKKTATAKTCYECKLHPPPLRPRGRPRKEERHAAAAAATR